MQTYFAPGLTANQAAVKAGSLPNVVLTKEFFDCFVLMGGCGAAICLLIAILIFSRNRAKRGLGYTASFSMLFNINELMVFGLPVIFNPVMLIPFLMVPLVCYSVSYLAISTGLVPFITSSVEWTTPIILGGFKATGSVWGALLQVFNVIVGVLIYMPFVRLLDRETDRHAKQDYDRFMEYFKSNLDDMATIKLTERNDMYGDFAKGIAAEIRHGLGKQMVMAYQPQYSYEGQIVGVEALLRWKHPVHGFLFPPLVVKLASEMNILPDLEEAVFRLVF